MSELRWGVFVRGPEDPAWVERFRWTGNDLEPLADEEAAQARAQQTRQWHPGRWEVEARQTTDPLPGTWDETYLTLLEALKTRGNSDE